MDAVSAVGIFLLRFEKRGRWNTGDEAEMPFHARKPNRQEVWEPGSLTPASQ